MTGGGMREVMKDDGSVVEEYQPSFIEIWKLSGAEAKLREFMKVPISKRYYKQDKQGRVVFDYQEGRSPFMLVTGQLWREASKETGNVMALRLADGNEKWRRIGIVMAHDNYCDAYICVREGYLARFVEWWNDTVAKIGFWCSLRLLRKGAIQDGDLIPRWSLAHFFLRLRIEAEL